MLESYDDIRKRIPEPPKWFDCHGVPRYDDFHPDLSPNIYADEVLLYEISCQSCDERFLVEENLSRYDVPALMRGVPNPSLSERVKTKCIHYGDPPRHNNCVGDTMNCNDLKTVQFWRRDMGKMLNWERVPECEGVDLADAEEVQE